MVLLRPRALLPHGSPFANVQTGTKTFTHAFTRKDFIATHFRETVPGLSFPPGLPTARGKDRLHRLSPLSFRETTRCTPCTREDRGGLLFEQVLLCITEHKSSSHRLT